MKKLTEIIAAAKAKGRKTLVAAYANDSHTLGATSKAIDEGIVDVILVGDKATIEATCKAEGIDVNKYKEIVQEADETKAAKTAVALINEGKGQILMFH